MLRPTCVLLLCLATIALAEMEGFIVGGKLASIDHHAHSAFINVNCVSDGGRKIGWICGSSVLNQQILLSAGHCLFGCTYESYISINIGSENRAQGQAYSSYGFVIHEDYSPKTSANDLGLIRVNGLLMLGNKTTRVALMKSPPYNEKATVAGWGMVDEVHQRQSNYLKYLTQKVWTRKDCLGIFKYMPKGTICGANGDPNDYASLGDSGSALVVRGYIQIGLVSYKIPSISRHIIVYTDVGYFYKWIRYYSKMLMCNG